MKTFILAIIFLLIGGAIGGFVGFGFGTGMGAGGGLIVGTQAGTCLALGAARDKGIKTLVLHTGGEARRGKTSNDMIEAVMPGADYVVVVASGNKDRLFNTLAAKRNIPVVEVEKTTALADAIRAIFK